MVRIEIENLKDANIAVSESEVVIGIKDKSGGNVDLVFARSDARYLNELMDEALGRF
jgi:hypothetical protein